MVLSKVEKPAIEAVLVDASAAKLKELAKNYYVKGYSKMNKPALVQAVSTALREPGRMEEFLYIIDHPTFLLFRRAAKSREPVKVKKARLSSAICWRISATLSAMLLRRI